MFYRKIIILVILCLVSVTSSAADSVWKKSYQLSVKGDYEQAAALIEPMARSKNEYALLRTAYLNYLQGEYSDSISYYNKAIDLNPNSIDAKLGVTLPLMAQQRWRQVKSYALQVLSMSHWNYVAHVRLMVAEEGLRKWTKLKEHSAQLAEAYPSDATALVYLARANIWLGDVTAANAAYEEVLVRIPDHIEASSYLQKKH